MVPLELFERIRNLEEQVRQLQAAQDDIKKRIVAAQQTVNLTRNAAAQ